jgi:hypothetical protein
VAESEVGRGELRHYVVVVGHSLAGTSWVKGVKVIGEGLVACSRRAEGVEGDLRGRNIQLGPDV